MFILVVPMYSKRELNADSNYLKCAKLIRAVHRIATRAVETPEKLRAVAEKTHFFILFPSGSKYSYFDDGTFRLPNVTRIAQHVSPRKLANAVSYDATFFDTLFRTYGFDVVWTHLPECAHHLRVASEPTYDERARPAVVASHGYTIHDSLGIPLDTCENVLLQQLSGSLGATRNVFISEYGRFLFRDVAQRYLSEEMVARALSASTIIYNGFVSSEHFPDPQDAPALLRARRCAESYVPVISYNHRLISFKRYKETFDLLSELHHDPDCAPFRVRFLNNTRDRIKRIAHLPFVELCITQTYSDYIAQLSETDIGISNSAYETLCNAAVESQALGSPLVAPRAVTFPEITPKENHSLLFSSPREQKDALRSLIENHRRRAEAGAHAARFAKTRFDDLRYAVQYLTLFSALVPPSLGTPDDARDLLRTLAMTSHRGKTVRELHSKLTQTRVNGRLAFGPQSCTMTKLVRLLREENIPVRVVRGEQRIGAS